MRKRLSAILFVFLLVSILAYTNSGSSPFYYFQGLVQQTLSLPKELIYKTKTGFGQEGREITRLREENRKLIEKIVDHEILKKDNTALRSQFDSGLTGVESSPVSPQQLLPAKVVGFTGPYNLPHTLILDKGGQDGVVAGMSVVSGKNLVGFVSNASKNYSAVTLVLSRNFQTVGRTLTTGATGIIKGEEDFMLLDRVVVTDALSSGDIVVTRGEIKDTGLGIQPDLIVGKITSVQSETSAPFQSAKVESLVNFAKLSTVFVVVGL